MIAKRSNTPVVKVASHAVPNIWLYDFIYLTIPTTERVNCSPTISQVKQQFKIQLFNEEDLSAEYYSTINNGLCFFNTHKLYQLKITRINWLFKKGIELLKKFQPSKYKNVPGENDILSFVTLYNHTPENIHGINEILKILQLQGIKQLVVCCRRNDPIFNTLKKNAINQYAYYIVSDFELNTNDKVTIDARCL